MKQTSSALTFLLAQYRAIFKRAYIKGIASAVILTAGLATGQAQAQDVKAPSDYYIYHSTGNNWTNFDVQQNAVNNNNHIFAGALAGDNIALAKPDDTITNGDTASGAKIVVSDGSDRHLTSMSGNVWGGNAQDTGNAYARDNKVTVSGTATINFKKSTTSGGDVIGGRAISDKGIAYVSDNKVTVQKVKDKDISIAGVLKAGYAEGFTGAVAEGGEQKIYGLENAHQAIGNHVIVGHAIAKENGTGNYVAQNNTLELKYVDASSSKDLFIVGGQADSKDATAKGSFSALNNTITIKNSTLSGDSSIVRVIGNYAESKNAEGGLVKVQGTEDKTSVLIEDSTITSGTIIGGRAGASGNATASYNSVVLTDTTFNGTGSIVNGASVDSKLATNQTAKLTASGNTVEITKSASNKAKTLDVTAGIYGASITASSANQKLSGSSITANDNVVTIGAGVNILNSEIQGAQALVSSSASSSSGSTVNLSCNKVVLNGTFTNTDIQKKLIVGALTNEKAGDVTMTDNSVTIAGDTSQAEIIGASLSLTDGGSKDATLTGNSVVVEADAEVTKSSINAARSLMANAVMTNNDVTIKGSLRDVPLITGGAGADSVVSLEDGSLYHVTSANAGTKKQYILSDVVNLAGTVQIANDSSLQISGFYQNGKQLDTIADTTTFNPNETTIASSANILNAGTLTLLGQTTVEEGAALHATTSSAGIVVKGKRTDAENAAGDVEVDFVNKGGASLKISSAQLKSYLNSGDSYTLPEDTHDQEDVQGYVQLTSGGVLEFGDSGSVNLNDFEYVSSAAVPGKIYVDSSFDANNGSILKGDDLVLAHKFASDNEHLDTDSFDAAGIAIQANKLTLGSTSLYSDKSAEIAFDHADVSSNVTFATNGKYTEKDPNKSGEFTGFRLEKFDLNLDAKFEVKDVDGKHLRYEALSGTLDGADVRVKDSGSINVYNGNWTANNSITLASGGSLVVGSGAASALGDQEHMQALKTDATLTLSDALVIDLTTDASATANIKVQGANDNFYNAEDPNDKLALLDLRQGLTLQGKVEDRKGTANIDVTKGGVVLLDANSVNTILADTTVGVKFNGDSHGSYVVDGDIHADFGDFGNGKTGFNLGTKGFLFANSLRVINTPTSNEAIADENFKSVNFGGNIVVDDLIISDLQRTTGADKPADAGHYASEVNISGGNVYVFNSLASDNHTVGLTNSSEITFVKTDATATGGITAGELRLGDNSKAHFVNGVWEGNTDFTLSGSGSQLNIGDGDTDNWENRLDSETSTKMAGGKLTVTGTDAKVNVYSDGEATFQTAALTTGEVNVYGDLTILGDAKATTADGKDDATNGVSFGSAITIENNGHLTFGAAATNGAILEDNVAATATTVSLKKGFKQIQNNGGMLELGLSGSVFSADAIKDLKSQLFTDTSLTNGILNNGGVLNIGQATFVGLKDKITDNGDGTYTATWNDIKGWSDIYSQNLQDITNNVLGNTIITNIDPGVGVQGNYGALRMSQGLYNDPSTKVTIAGATSLRNAAINGGKFISNADGSVTFGADIQKGKTLTLIGGGDIGDITMQAGNTAGAGDVERDYTILRITSTAEDPITNISSITVAATNTNTAVDIQGNTAVSGDISNIDTVDVSAALSATNIDVNSLYNTNGTVEVSDTITANEAELVGGSVTTANFDFEGGNNTDNELIIYNGAQLTVTDTLHIADKGDIRVGGVLSEADSKDEAGNTLTGTGLLSVAKLDLDQGTLWVDPAYGEQTSIGAVGYFEDNNSKSAMVNDAGIVNGNIYVGQNAALGIGTTDINEVADAISRYQTNGSLSKDQYGSILYLNGQIELRDGAELALNSAENVASRTNYREVLRYTVEPNVVDQYADMGLGANTAILMTEAAFEDADGNKTQTAIKFNKTGATLNAEGGEIVLVGSFDAAQSLNFFEDNDGEGHKGVYIYGQDVKVYTQNGFLFTTLEAGTEAGYDEVLHVDTDRAFQVMSEASDPVVNTLISYHEDRLPADNNSGNDTGNDNGADPEGGEQTVAGTEIKDIATKTAQAETKETTEPTPIEPPVNNTPATKVTGSSSFLNEVVTASHGAPAEQAARLAVYGGAAQVGLAAANSNSDILESRFGIGANAQSLNVAQNGMGGTLWVAPIYKSQDSDGFDAQGLDYGVDFDLYGVALGGDYKVTNEITVGAMFNVGSGSLDGQGNTAAAGTSNDFDYFGFALYGAYQAGALTVTGDLSYTQIDNDLEGSNEVGKLTASSDTSAWSLGVTGQYQFTFASVDVTPHAGLRFTSLDLDDYSLEAAGHGTVANYDGDTMSVFSIPVGVTFAKSFEGESWTVTPALDLQVTGQFGDDEAEGSVAWTGTNLSTSVTSEVFDNFTYGATLGVEAQSNSFSFGVGVGYTGSSNVDEFGVNANARFTF